MSCPSVEELLAGGGVEHAARCPGCKTILELSATRAAPLPCGRAETLMAARAAGPLAADNEQALLRHLETCADCLSLARALEAPVVADVLAGAAETEGDFTELSVVAADNYVRGVEIGRGGMGQIVRARDRRLGRAVAIKELIDERLRPRFEHEARLTAKLQHPAIVSVYEAGCWPSGAPFYAMKYVAGRPLDQVVAGMKTLDERIGLLPNLTTVVEAIAYAHSEHVVHRDLKPQNILIGAFGEIVVIDWGLAKDLAATPEAGAPYRGDGGTLTQAGAGTPAYMAPEQARGEVPDERVDVYALGATLHHVLAGDRPDVRPLSAETPRDLRAIVAKAMAPNKEDRYPTATELAGELKRFQEGQLVLAHRYSAGELVRRWLRRHQRIVALAAGFAVILAGTAGVSVRRIVAERDRADSQRRGAERLVDYMLGTLTDRLGPMGKLDVLAGIGKEVEVYFASVPTSDESDPAVLRDRARAFGLLSRVDQDKGRFADARAEAEQQRNLCRRWADLAATTDSGLCIVAALRNLAGVASYQGANDEALAFLTQARQRMDDLLAQNPTNVDLRRKSAGLQYFVGFEYKKRRDIPNARAAYRAGIETIEALIAEDPKNTAYLDILSSHNEELADLELRTGNPEGALARLDRVVELRSRWRELAPDDGRVPELLAAAATKAGEAATLLGKWDVARASFERGRAVLRSAVAADPDNAAWLSNLATNEAASCVAEVGSGGAQAQRECHDAVDSLERLLAKDPTRESAAVNLANTVAWLAELEVVRHDLAGAHAAAGRALDIATAWNRKKPGSSLWLTALAAAEVSRAEVARAEGRTAEARVAAAVADAAIVAVADDFEAEGLRAHAGLILAELDDTDAEARYRRLLAELDGAVARWPAIVELRARLAQTALGLAGLLEKRSYDSAEARALRERAKGLIAPLQQSGALAAEFRGLAGGRPRRRRWLDRATTGRIIRRGRAASQGARLCARRGSVESTACGGSRLPR